jgi:hypothetical protein
MREWSREPLKHLRTILAGLYPGDRDARRVARDAGLDPAMIAFEQKAINTWFEILEYANGRRKVEEVLRIALEEFPGNEALEQSRAGVPPAPVEGPPPGEWRGPAAAPVLEKLTSGASTLVPITYFELGLVRSRPVVRVKRSDGSSGTGFLTTDNRLVTNHHVLPSPETAATSVIQFNYQQTLEGLSAEAFEVRLVPERLFRTSVADDWTVVAVEGDPAARWGCIELAPHPISRGERVNIIQHPGGGPKQISLASSVVVFSGDGRVQYLADTLPGSSGSPVFDARWNLVALHHSGGWLTEPNAAKGDSYYRNEGIAIDRLLAGLAS